MCKLSRSVTYGYRAACSDTEAHQPQLRQRKLLNYHAFRLFLRQIHVRKLRKGHELRNITRLSLTKKDFLSSRMFIFTFALSCS